LCPLLHNPNQKHCTFPAPGVLAPGTFWLVYLTWIVSCLVTLADHRPLLTRRRQHDTDVYLSKRCKTITRIAASNRTIKLSL